MPLITSPIDGSPMQQINRYGIEIDVCPTSGGIWLDKGELEKLMHIIREESVNDQRGFAAIQERAYQSKTQSRSYSDRNDGGYYKHKSYKKKSKMSKLLDIFDL